MDEVYVVDKILTSAHILYQKNVYLKKITYILRILLHLYAFMLGISGFI